MNSQCKRHNRLNTLACVMAVLVSLLMPVVTQAADWLRWRNVGAATFTWGPFTLYHARLLSPDGRYNGLSSDLALVITYQRAINHSSMCPRNISLFFLSQMSSQTPFSYMFSSPLPCLPRQQCACLPLCSCPFTPPTSLPFLWFYICLCRLFFLLNNSFSAFVAPSPPFYIVPVAQAVTRPLSSCLPA